MVLSCGFDIYHLSFEIRCYFIRNSISSLIEFGCMRINHLHSWNVSPKEAIKIQQELREKVEVTDKIGNIKIVAGVDVGFKGKVARAAVVVISFPQLEPVDQAVAEVPVTFPYVPGLLAFREGPAVLAALEKLETKPDLFVFDAQGFAHPRRMGLASHIGVIVDKPSIGCAKSRLCGTHQPVPDQIGAKENLVDKGEIIGAVVRSKSHAQPLYISIGHKINLENAVKFVLACTKQGSRLPETTILAHKVAGGEDLTLKKPSTDQQSLFTPS